jgi:hypothetical protein
MAKSKKVAKKNENKIFTVEQLVNQANVAMSSMQLELAEKFYCRALVMAPEDTNIMDALADVYLQLGEMDNALQLLIKSTSLAPQENPYKWMFLGQLQSGLDSIESYRTGINILLDLLESVEQASFFNSVIYEFNGFVSARFGVDYEETNIESSLQHRRNIFD